MFTLLTKQNLNFISYRILWQGTGIFLQLLMQSWLQSINGSKLCFEKLLSKIDLQIYKFITHDDAFIIISFKVGSKLRHLQPQDY